VVIQYFHLHTAVITATLITQTRGAQFGLSQLHWSLEVNVGVRGQFADKPTRGQSSLGLVNLRTSQLAEMFNLKNALSVILDRLHYLYAANI